MKILLIEPFFTGSHAAWATELAKRSSHDIEILKLSGHYWKWRMHGGAITLAKQYKKLSYKPDLILATDMLDLTTFLSLTRRLTYDIPVIMYFHENQLNYPWSDIDRNIIDKRDNHYSFINYASVLAADSVLFNSDYHRNAFLDELPRFLKSFPDNHELSTIEMIRNKSEVLHLGLDLQKFDTYKVDSKQEEEPVILWNHRWEYDKNPESFFHVLFRLHEKDLPFKLVILGENYSTKPEIFEEAKEKLNSRILQFGYAKGFKEYAEWMWRSDILPVTSIQDFFGISVMEAAYCACLPLLPKMLAYPEHFLPEKFPGLFYNDEIELEFKLQEIIERKLWLNKNEELRNAIFKYDWNTIIGEYDRKFKEIKESSY